MGRLACAVASSENEIMAVKVGSQLVWGIEGGDSDETVVTLRSSRAPPVEDAFYISGSLRWVE